MTDQEILTCLQENPERGMEQIVEQYTGLLWSVAGQLLRDPEDIKDCVNETFADFFGQLDRFEPAKGSLKGYLAVIAHRLAIKKYQENHRAAGEEFIDGESVDAIGQFEQKEELDAYLRTLELMDEQIIRMKYYDGMTAKEIAASLGLPYETVKKRHQRSLKKLRKAMLIGLIVVLLATLVACAYVVLRYFGIVPGYGVCADPTAGVYVMEKETVTVSSEEFDLTITDAWWMNGILTIDGTAMMYDYTEPDFGVENVSEREFGRLTIEGLKLIQGVQNLSNSQPYGGESARRFLFMGELPEGAEDILNIDLRWENGTVCTIALKKVESEFYEQAGYYDMTEDEGGLLAIPRLENGELIVAIYPLDEGDYVIEPLLNAGRWRFEEDQDITVTAADGTVLTGTMMRTDFSTSTFYEWNFGLAEPGKYTLNVPYVYQTLSERAVGDPVVETVALGDEERDLDVVFAVCGGEVRLTHVEPVDFIYAIDSDVEQVRTMNEYYARFRWWDIDSEYVSLDSERTMVGASLQVRNDADDVQFEFDGITIGIPQVMHIDRTEPLPDGTTRQMSGMRVGCYFDDVAELMLDPQCVGYRWNHEFSIEFEVDETE